MLPSRRLFRSAALLAAPALLAVRAVRRALGAGTPSRSETRPPLRPPVVAPVPAGQQSRPADTGMDQVTVFASQLPIASYDALNARDAGTAIKALTDVEQVRVMLRYEEENAKRTTVHRVARTHLAALEGSAATA